HVLLYNVQPTCRCEDCAGDAGRKHAEAFVVACREKWRKVRPSARIGHVGVELEYANLVDSLHPFLSVQRKTEGTPVDADGLVTRAKKLVKNAKSKPVVPLAKICWASATKNKTEDVVSILRSSRKHGISCLLWYYGWVFHPEGDRYDPKAVVEGLGGNWEKLKPFLPEEGEKQDPPAKKPADAREWIYFPSKESREGAPVKLVLRGSGAPVELPAARDAALIAYLADRPGGFLPQLAVQMGDQNRFLVAFDLSKKLGGRRWKSAELVLDLRLPKALAASMPFDVAVHVVKEPWVENQVCWKNQPAVEEDPALVVKVKPEEGVVRWNVTPIVKRWLTRRAANHGLLVKVQRPVKTGGPVAPSSGGNEAEVVKRLARTLDWETDVQAALDKGAERKQLILACVRVKGQDKPEQLLQALVFADPVIVALVKKRFVPLRLSYNSHAYALAGTGGARGPDPLVPLGTKCGDLKAPGLCVATPDGRMVASIESIGTFDRELFHRFLLQALAKGGAYSKLRETDAEALLEGGALSKAERAFRKRKPPARDWGLCRVAALKGDHEKALDLAEKLAKKKTTLGADALVQKGVSLVRLGRLEKGEKALNKALLRKKKPSRLAEALYFAGLLAHRRRDPEGAKTLWVRLKKEEPDGLWALKASACLTWPERIGYETLKAIPDLPKEIRCTERAVRGADEAKLQERAVAYLLSRQEKDGSWPHMDAPYWRAPVTALVAHALFRCAEDLKGEARKEAERGAEEAERWILNFLDTQDPVTADSFGAAYILEFLLARHARKESPETKAAVEKAIRFLFGGQCPNGAWSYNLRFCRNWKGGFSGWPKTDKGRTHSMNTGPAVLYLAEAKKRGFAVDEKGLERGVKALQAMRSGPGVYTYTFPGPRNFDKADQSLGRGPVCEQALFAVKRVDATALRKTVDTFLRYRKDLRITVKLTKGWTPPRCVSNYFYFFAYYHAASAIRALGSDAAKAMLPALRADLLAVPELDATWVDSHMAGKPFGTAMALLVLKMAKDAR
ncbi:MAG: DNRLRE domain-containing protein, partial [Planctomycetota bacterium]